MTVSATHKYAAPIDEVIRFFSDPELLEEKFLALSARQPEVKELSETDDGFIVVTSRHVPAQVPAVLKSILGAYNQVIQKDQWCWQDDNTLRCDLAIELAGVPATIRGNLLLQSNSDNSQCQNQINIKISSSVPLIGGALRDFIGKDVARLVEAEYQYIQQRLRTLEPLE